MAKLILIALLLLAGWLWLRRFLQPRTPIDEREARAILGVGPSDGPDAIRAAHRKLVGAVHPDRGGSAELARRINIARDVLLKRRDD